MYTIKTISGWDKKKELYEVQWIGYDGLKTYEKPPKIPSFIRDFYRNPANFGVPLPNPKVIDARKVGQDEVQFLLSWTGKKDSGSTWYNQSVFDMLSDEGRDALSIQSVTCRTLKVSISKITHSFLRGS